MSKYVLLPQQAASVARATDAPGRRWLFADEMGCGKTGQAIMTLKAYGAERVLVVAPALARPGWVQQIGLWWPERAGDVALLDMSPGRKSQSKKRAATWGEVLQRNIRVVSPQLFDLTRDGPAFLGDGGAIVIDEAHMLANPRTRQAKAMQAMTRRHRGPVLALTATPVPNRAIGLWNIIDTIWHRRLGNTTGEKVSFAFCERYLTRQYNAFGSEWGSLRMDTAAELQERLSWMMTRVTRLELAGLIPPCQIVPLAVPAGSDIRAVVRDWLPEAVMQATHVVVLTHLRESARVLAALASEVAPGVPVLHFDGGLPTTQRVAKLAALREQPAGIVVTTMHAVAESISLSWCSRALLAELYWSPKVLEQVVGRFPRLDGVMPTMLEVLCGTNTTQERIAHSVSDKLWQIQHLMAQGAAARGLALALDSQDSLAAAIADAAYCVLSDEELSEMTDFFTGEEGDE